MRRIARPSLPLLAALALCLALGLAAFAGLYASSRSLEKSVATGEGTLRLAVAALDGQLARYHSLPTLISEQSVVHALLADPGDRAARGRADDYLKRVNALLSSSDVYVMLPSGETVAASNAGEAWSFVGQNFRYRPYFEAAAQGRRGRFYGLGTTSGKRGYYFSAPVLVAGAIEGIVVVKVDLDPLEASWASGEFEILVVDPEGIVFMAGNPQWRFSGFGPLHPAALARTREMRRYDERAIAPLDMRLGRDGDGLERVRIPTSGESRDYVALSEAMPEAGWTVKVLIDTRPAALQGIAFGSAALFLSGIGALAFASVHQRRRRLAERDRIRAEAHEELERRVLQRTADLAVVNHRLGEEVAERRATEETLRRTQSDLVEAGKLAALGQMSAALSHEFNQPLAAASAYADSAAVLLDRGRVAEARENVLRIASLVDRLSSISRHLRTFARRPDEQLVEVRLETVIADALEIVDWRLKAADAAVAVDVDPDVGPVLAVSVRLQQILVNLVSNAADAVEGTPRRTIAITAAREAEGRTRLCVSDSGPGVPDAIAARIFDPFFTTKGVGKGLGLGLSISYNIARDFGGALLCEKGPDGGARFAVILTNAREPMRSAAE
ncbi:ATP-binding protein [Aurantimonas sp. Leaf443]|uniref:sensor histidine kinase n=1 Tax=Aurantimonas sp. Leaf443 TaxID=1736378 RepID=UPI0006FB32E8|nr:ATP-binding protein [Aurantimonas sp. Leaf443]KQT87993.1 histidine kinase [Aurantimonas sp. Leaf443]